MSMHASWNARWLHKQKKKNSHEMKDFPREYYYSFNWSLQHPNIEQAGINCPLN